MYGNKLKELRKENNVLLKDLANILNISRSMCGRYETEYATIPIKHLNVICNYFEVSFDYIFSLTDVRQYEAVSKEIVNINSGKRLKEFRKENKITQKSLGDYLNTTQSVIAGYESGRRLIATPFLYAICKKYKISADYLLGRVDNPKYLN